jgi:hypothetical protein
MTVLVAVGFLALVGVSIRARGFERLDHRTVVTDWFGATGVARRPCTLGGLMRRCKRERRSGCVGFLPFRQS